MGRMMKVENWNGYDIRFLEKDHDWWCVLNDISDALGLSEEELTKNVKPEFITKVDGLVDDILLVNELGFYDILLTSHSFEGNKFRHWSTGVLQKLRKRVGLEQYEIMRMTDDDIQEEISHMLDNLFWDDEKQMLMESVTTPGGDVDQVPFGDF